MTYDRPGANRFGGIRVKWRAMSPQARRATIAAVVLVGVGGVVWAGIASHDEERDRTQSTSRGGMPGMAGMDMSGDGSAVLTAEQITQFGVTFGTAEVRTLENAVRATGVVTVDETQVVQVAPKVAGFAERLYVDFTGQPVRRGQPLLELYSPELVAAQQELLVARRLEQTLDGSSVPGVPRGTSDLLGATRRRLQLWDISNAQIVDVLRTGRVRRTMTLYSPATGVVTEKQVVRGQEVRGGMPLYTITDLSQVWIEVEVPEADASALRVGAGADIELVAYPGRTLKGRVSFIHPTVDTTTRRIRPRVTVTNSGMLLKPGMYATVRLYSPARAALTVPTSAVIRTGERDIVFVDMGGGRLMPHEVQIGRTTAEFTEVLAGVEPGQRVVTSAQFLLESEANLGEVMKAMMSQMGAADMGDMKGMEGMDDMPGMKMP